MKTKSLIINCFFVFAVFFTALISNSCSKDQTIPYCEKKEFSDILILKDMNEYTETLNKVLTMSRDEQTSFESSKGYKSFGRLSEEFYFNIDPENFKSFEEIELFVTENSHFLQLTKDEENELYLETVLSNSIDRYLINNEKMYILGKTVYKVFKEGKAYTELNNIEELRNLSIENALLLQENDNIGFIPCNEISNEEIMLKDIRYNCGTEEEEKETNGNERTRIEIWLTDEHEIDDGLKYSWMQNRVLIRPLHRVLGVWYWCTRTISCDIQIAIDIQKVPGGNWFRYFHTDYKYNIHDSKIELFWIMDICPPGGSYCYFNSYHYGGYDSWADTPDTSPVVIQCNTQLF